MDSLPLKLRLNCDRGESFMNAMEQIMGFFRIESSRFTEIL